MRHSGKGCGEQREAINHPVQSNSVRQCRAIPRTIRLSAAYCMFHHVAHLLSSPPESRLRFRAGDLPFAGAFRWKGIFHYATSKALLFYIQRCYYIVDFLFYFIAITLKLLSVPLLLLRLYFLKLILPFKHFLEMNLTPAASWQGCKHIFVSILGYMRPFQTGTKLL